VLTPEEFITQWGQEELARFSPETLQSVAIPASGKSFLSQVGLPRTAAIPTGGAGDFQLLPALHLTETADYSFGIVRYEPDFGHETYFCIERTTGVIQMRDNQNATVYYVNTNVSAFAEALLAYRSFMKPNESGLSKDSDSRRLRRLKQEIKAFDPKAMTKRINYWPLMLADLAAQI